MKTKRVLLIVEPPKRALDRAFDVMKKLEKKYAGVSIISFPDFDTLGKVITSTRLELLAAIRHQKPKSIQQLARFLKRDFKNVYQDLRTLEEFGLVETKVRTRGRAAAPLAKFEEIILAA